MRTVTASAAAVRELRMLLPERILDDGGVDVGMDVVLRVRATVCSECCCVLVECSQCGARECVRCCGLVCGNCGGRFG